MGPDEINNALQILGLSGLLAFALIAIFKKWVVMGWQYSALEEERDEWKSMALDGLKAASAVAQAARNHTVLTDEEADEVLRRRRR